MDLSDKHVLVVGANGVLGGQIARGLAEAGALVIGTARTAESSVRLEGSLTERLLVDVGDAASISALVDYLNARGVDGIVNAAGLVGFGAPADTRATDAARLMQVNHLGPASLITGLLPALRASAAAGRTPFISSITGVVAERAFPGMSAYVASKTAHSAWLRALRMDLRRDGIRVLEARPGHTETGLAERALFGISPRFAAGLAPDHVAAVIVRAIAEDGTELPSESFSG